MSVIFPKWTNALPTVGAIGAVCGLTAVVLGFWYWATPSFWEVGYMPRQPGTGFSHQIHAGKLGMDCLYCHSHVEESGEANVPSVTVCMGCHSDGKLKPDFAPPEKVAFIREAYESDKSIPWRRVHKLPDYVTFPHSVHLKAGVSCYSCHGQITAMPVVNQKKSLGMGWCLECHRGVHDRPGDFLVPPEKVTDLLWVENNLGVDGKQRIAGSLDPLTLNPPENCSACHY